MNSYTNVQQLDLGDKEFKFSDFFDFQKEIGRGGFAHVVLAKDKDNLDECAVKILDKKSVSKERIKFLRQEANILKQLNHKNIVKFKCVKETDTKILISMEYVCGGSLQNLMKQRNSLNETFSENEISLLIKYGEALLSALEYIHSKNIVHRDMKPGQNILVADVNDLTTAKVADFGLSATFGENWKTLTQQCGTLLYMAPEHLISKIYSKPIDIWSVGIILFRLLANGQHPFYSNEDTVDEYKQKLRNLQINNLENISEKPKSLLLRLMQKEPADRYTATQALMHPWLTNQDDDVPQTINEIVRGWDKKKQMIQVMRREVIQLDSKNNSLNSLVQKIVRSFTQT